MPLIDARNRTTGHIGESLHRKIQHCKASKLRSLISHFYRKHKMQRFPTGVPGLDDILNGGLLQGGVYILEGPPGVGKTTLANQIAYAHTRSRGRTLYVTMLAESHARMLQHMEKQTFFNRELVNSAVFYVSGYRDLENEGLKGVLGLLRGELSRHQASFVVVDGVIVESRSENVDASVRQFVHELQSLVTAMNATCLLLTSGNGQPMSAEQTMVDGIFAFEDHSFHWRAERRMQVRKFRGSEVARGSHTFCITNDGIRFFPRLESMPLPIEPEDLCQTAVSSGISALDAVLHGNGLPSGSSSIVVGHTGAGKTSLAMAFAAASTDSERGVMLASTETERRLKQLGASLEIPVDQALNAGLLTIHPMGQNDESLDELAYRLLRLVDEHGAKRLVVDGVSGMVDTLAFPERGFRFIGRLLTHLSYRGVTSFFTVDQHALAAAAGTSLVGGVLAWFDNVFELLPNDLSSKHTRILKLRKLRGLNVQRTEVDVGQPR